MVTTKPTILLSEAFPNWSSRLGIFTALGGNMPWSSTIADESVLDYEYFGNHSGDKKCSPLVYKLMDENYEVTGDGRSILAQIIQSRFLFNWQALWNTYHIEYDPLSDYRITETGEDEEESSSDKSSARDLSKSGTDNLNIQHGESIAKNGTDTGTDNVSMIHGEQIQTNDTINTEKHDFKYGYNSLAENPVPTEDSTGKSVEQKIEAHSGTDQSNRTLNLANSETETHSGNDSHNRILNLSDSESVVGNESANKSGRYSKVRSGMSGNHSAQELIRTDRELWIEDFFTRVFQDVDTVLASMVYNREHPINPYSIFPFGYGNI